MKWLALFLALSFAGPAFAQGAAQPAPSPGAVGPATPLTPSPDVRAKQWLGLVDDQNYNDAYKQMSASAQGKITPAAWAARISQLREPLGAMSSRDIKAIRLTKVLPGMQDGQSATVQFDTSFAHKAPAVETVELASEKGAWSVTGYSIK
jgi:hypothetical protein